MESKKREQAEVKDWLAEDSELVFGEWRITVMESMTYGKLPTREEFDAAFEAECPRGKYGITLGRSDSEMLGPHFGDGAYTADQLWIEIERTMDDTHVTRGDESGDAMLDFVSSIMFTLGFEWV